MTRLPPAVAAELAALGLGGAAERFIPPAAVAEAARRGLDLRARHGRGGTKVGLARAASLAAGDPQTAQDLRVMAAWFARFAHLRGRGRWDDAANPSAGFIAWLLWGGDAGREWAQTARHPET